MKNWNKDIVLPTASDYVLYCLDATFGPSKSSGNPMITLKFEIRSPATVNVAGEDINIAGVEVPFYATTQNLSEPDKDQSLYARVFHSDNADELSLYQLFEITLPDDFDKENPPVDLLKGKFLYAQVKSDSRAQRKSPTAEQLKNGIREGDVMVNPKTKKPLMSHYPKIVELYGIAPDPSVTAGAFA